MKQQLKDRQGPREIRKKDERDGSREVSEFEKRYSTHALQRSILQLNKAVEANEHRAVSVDAVLSTCSILRGQVVGMENIAAE